MTALLFVSFLGLLLLGVPVAVALGGSSLLYVLAEGATPPLVVLHSMAAGVDSFPLLAVHRSGVAQYAMHTLELGRLTQPWSLHYILGPLDIIEGRQLKDICVAVAKIVGRVIKRRGHAAYQGGRLQFFGDVAGEPAPFSSVRLVSHEGPGQAVFGGNESAVLFWAIEMRLETTELTRDDPDAEGGEDSEVSRQPVHGPGPAQGPGQVPRPVPRPLEVICA